VCVCVCVCLKYARPGSQQLEDILGKVVGVSLLLKEVCVRVCVCVCVMLLLAHYSTVTVTPSHYHNPT